ncbi:MAG: class I SAM-dependent methyltransferase [Candidatus Kariarchaeaceae archaeon]|jgi:SAM-dependent methyltransferase
MKKGHMALTDKEYWDFNWRSINIPSRLNTNAYFGNHFNELFINKLKKGDMRFLEVGCAPGKFMIYFAENFGYRVSGIEYSQSGYEITCKNLEACGIEGNIIHGDLFEYPFNDKWNIVFSAGFVEHYVDPLYVLRRKYSLVEPGGVLITTIPNYAGYHGSIIKVTDNEIYRKHMPFTAGDLYQAYNDLGMKNIDTGYFGSIRLQYPRSSSLTVFKTSILYVAKLADIMVNVLYNKTKLSLEGPKLSSHIYAYGVKPYTS